jgi:hypothetical protein
MTMSGSVPVAAADQAGLVHIIERKLKKTRPHLINGLPGRHRPVNRTLVIPSTTSSTWGKRQRVGH